MPPGALRGPFFFVMKGLFGFNPVLNAGPANSVLIPGLLRGQKVGMGMVPHL